MSVRKRLKNVQEDDTLQIMEGDLMCCDDKVKLRAVTGFQYTVDLATTALTEITVERNGEETVIPIPSYEPSKKNARIAIANALKSAGYDPYYSMDNIIGVSVDKHQVHIIGDIHVTGIKAGATALILRQRETQTRVHGFKVGGGLGTNIVIAVDGNSTSIAIPAAQVPSQVMASTVLAQLDGLAGFDVAKMDLTWDGTEDLEITIYSNVPYENLTITAGLNQKLDSFAGFV